LTNFANRPFVSIFLQTTRQKPQLPFWERLLQPFLRQKFTAETPSAPRRIKEKRHTGKELLVGSAVEFDFSFLS